MDSQLYHKVQRVINGGFDSFGNKPNEKSIPAYQVTYGELEADIRRMIRYTRNDRFIGDMFHSSFVFGPTGVGKCLAKGTKILMADGTIKLVEDIKAGDAVMGPDSSPRNVLTTTSGKEMMYDVIPNKGEAYRVNESHILSLKITNGSKVADYRDGDIVNISVLDYIGKNKNFKHCAKGYKVGIDFDEKETPDEVPPYFLGLWLGDGNSNWPSITNVDEEVINYLNDFASSVGAKIYEDKGESKTTSYRISYGREGLRQNKVKDVLASFDLLNNKHIPLIYKTNSRSKRMELLAGLIDSDGYYFHGGFEIAQKNKVLAEDIMYVARSLGLGVSFKKVIKSAHKNHSGEYYKMFIYGDCSGIPTKIKRKMASTRKQKKNVLLTGIKVEPYKVDEYFGFSLDGADKRFVLGDFTVTHNTEIMNQIASDEDCIYHKLELQKVPVEILQGFPYLKNVTMDGSEHTVAKLAPSTILPPMNDKRTWVLHFDEFNKADPEKMAAVMNLIITGELGGSADYDEEQGKSVKYRLPRRTVIIGSGNPKEQDNVENLNIVNSMDNATSERWHRTMYLPYSAESWIENYAMKPFTLFGNDLATRIPAIILNFILNKALDTQKSDAPFTIPVISGSESGLEIERTTSPRSWTLVSDRMMLDALDHFENMSVEDKKIYVDIADKLEKETKTEQNAFNMYMNDPERQIFHFVDQAYEFGLKGNQIVKEVISNYIYFAENRVLPEDIVFFYKQNRKRVQNLASKKGAILYLLLGVAHYINSTKELESVERTAINISTFIQDAGINAEDVVAFIQTLDKSKKKHVEELKGVMYDISDRYKNAYGGYYYTSEREVK